MFANIDNVYNLSKIDNLSMSETTRNVNVRQII